MLEVVTLYISKRSKFNQAIELLETKFKREYGIDADIFTIKRKKSERECSYTLTAVGGGIWRVVLATEGSRGFRSNLILYDDAIDEDIVNTIIKPSLRGIGMINKIYIEEK